jgi:hypothetical protein
MSTVASRRLTGLLAACCLLSSVQGALAATPNQRGRAVRTDQHRSTRSGSEEEGARAGRLRFRLPFGGGARKGLVEGAPHEANEAARSNPVGKAILSVFEDGPAANVRSSNWNFKVDRGEQRVLADHDPVVGTEFAIRRSGKAHFWTREKISRLEASLQIPNVLEISTVDQDGRARSTVINRHFKDLLLHVEMDGQGIRYEAQHVIRREQGSAVYGEPEVLTNLQVYMLSKHDPLEGIALDSKTGHVLEALIHRNGGFKPEQRGAIKYVLGWN